MSSQVLITFLVALEFNKALDNLPLCGNEVVLRGDGKPKMTFSVKCTQLRGHIQQHSDGCSTW